MQTPSRPSPANADACTERAELEKAMFADQAEHSLKKALIQRNAISAAQIYSNVNAACPYPFGTPEAALFKQYFCRAVPRIAVKVPDLTDLPGARITGYYLNTSGPRGASGDGKLHAYGRHNVGYFICDQFGWSSHDDFTQIARALKAATDAEGGAA